MNSTLGWLGWLTLTFVGGLIAVPMFWRCDMAPQPPMYPHVGMFLVAAVAGTSLSAVILGITACRAARQRQRWGWFVSFLFLTGVIAIGTTNLLLGPGVLSLTLPVLRGPPIRGSTVGAGDRGLRLSWQRSEAGASSLTTRVGAKEPFTG